MAPLLLNMSHVNMEGWELTGSDQSSAELTGTKCTGRAPSLYFSEKCPRTQGLLEHSVGELQCFQILESENSEILPGA